MTTDYMFISSPNQFYVHAIYVLQQAVRLFIRQRYFRFQAHSSFSEQESSSDSRVHCRQSTTTNPTVASSPVAVVLSQMQLSHQISRLNSVGSFSWKNGTIDFGQGVCFACVFSYRF